MRVGRRLDRLGLLHVLREDEAGHAALGPRDAKSAIDDMPDLHGAHRVLHVFVRDVLEQAVEVDFLLVVAPHRAAGRLTHDRHDGDVIHLGVVEAVEQMNGARPGRRHAHAHLAGELRVRTGHERGELLVPRLDELDLVGVAGKGRQDAVDTVAGVPEHAAYSPVGHPLEQEIRDRLGHELLPGAGTSLRRAKGGATHVPARTEE